MQPCTSQFLYNRYGPKMFNLTLLKSRRVITTSKFLKGKILLLEDKVTTVIKGIAKYWGWKLSSQFFFFVFLDDFLSVEVVPIFFSWRHCEQDCGLSLGVFMIILPQKPPLQYFFWITLCLHPVKAITLFEHIIISSLRSLSLGFSNSAKGSNISIALFHPFTNYNGIELTRTKR